MKIQKLVSVRSKIFREIFTSLHEDHMNKHEETANNSKKRVNSAIFKKPVFLLLFS